MVGGVWCALCGVVCVVRDGCWAMGDGRWLVVGVWCVVVVGGGCRLVAGGWWLVAGVWCVAGDGWRVAGGGLHRIRLVCM